MPRLPLLSGQAVIMALAKAGYCVARQRGSHIRLSCPNRKSITVPDHKIIGRGLLLKILRDAELSTEEFSKLFV